MADVKPEVAGSSRMFRVGRDATSECLDQISRPAGFLQGESRHVCFLRSTEVKSLSKQFLYFRGHLYLRVVVVVAIVIVITTINSVALVRDRAIPTEQLSLVDKVSANFLRIESAT
jgi:hypothetical protein